MWLEFQKTSLIIDTHKMFATESHKNEYHTKYGFLAWSDKISFEEYIKTF